MTSCRPSTFLERSSEFLQPLAPPRPPTLRVQGCDGRINAYCRDYEVIVCCEYLISC
jgi:hypothetical protein